MKKNECTKRLAVMTTTALVFASLSDLSSAFAVAPTSSDIYSICKLDDEDNAVDDNLSTASLVDSTEVCLTCTSAFGADWQNRFPTTHRTNGTIGTT